LVIPIGFELHECRGWLVLWAERRHELLSKVMPRCEAHLSRLEFLP
jgi:hypothetical protein